MAKQKGSYIDEQGNWVDPKARRPWVRFWRTVRGMAAPILLVFVGLAVSELICLAGLIEALVSGRSNAEWGMFVFLLVVIPLMMLGTVAVGTLLPKHESDQIPGSGETRGRTDL